MIDLDDDLEEMKEADVTTEVVLVPGAPKIKEANQLIEEYLNG